MGGTKAKRQHREQVLPATTRRGGRRPFGYDISERGASGFKDNNGGIVPMIAKAISVSEHLLAHPGGMTAEEIQTATGYSRSSIYRILRTLGSFGYITREDTGRFFTEGIFAATSPNCTAIPTVQGFGSVNSLP